MNDQYEPFVWPEDPAFAVRRRPNLLPLFIADREMLARKFNAGR